MISLHYLYVRTRCPLSLYILGVGRYLPEQGPARKKPSSLVSKKEEHRCRLAITVSVRIIELEEAARCRVGEKNTRGSNDVA